MRSDWQFGPWKYDIVKKWATEITGMFTQESTRLGDLFGHLYFYLMVWDNQTEQYNPSHVEADAGLTLNEIIQTFNSIYRKRLVAFPHYFNSTEGNAESYDDMKSKLDAVLNLNYYKYKKLIEQMGFVYDPLQNKVKHETGTDTLDFKGKRTMDHDVTMDKLTNISLEGPVFFSATEGEGTTAALDTATTTRIDLVFDANPTVTTTQTTVSDTENGKITNPAQPGTVVAGTIPTTKHYNTTMDDQDTGRLHDYTETSGTTATKGNSSTTEGLRAYGKATIGNPNAYDFTDEESFTNRQNVRTVNLTTTEFEGDYADVILKQRELIKSNVLIEFFKDLEKEILLSSWG